MVKYITPITHLHRVQLMGSFRALHPLMTILERDMTNDWIKTFLLHYLQSGRLPVWELWGNETDCMIGYHSVSVISDAYMKGIRGYDAELALEAMVASADADLFGLDHYRERGYISSEDEPESVSERWNMPTTIGVSHEWRKKWENGYRYAVL